MKSKTARPHRHGGKKTLTRLAGRAGNKNGSMLLIIRLLSNLFSIPLTYLLSGFSPRHRARTFSFLLIAALMLSTVRVSTFTAAAAAPPQQKGNTPTAETQASVKATAALATLRTAANGQLVSLVARETGSYSFVRATGAAVLSPDNPLAAPETRALAFLGAHGAVVGLSDAERQNIITRGAAGNTSASELRPAKVERDSAGFTHVRLNQFYQGLPVFGAQLIVHMNGRGITGVNGHFVPDVKVGAAPRISPQAAADAALRFQVGGGKLRVVKTELSIYRTGLLEGYRGQSLLAYSVEVTDGKARREQLWINANNGALINRIALNHSILNRTIYTPQYDPENPDLFVVRREGDPPLPAPPGSAGGNPVNNLYDFAGMTYNLFASAFGRDSYDGLGHNMASVYLVNDQCPNAYWNGIATNYCPDLDADDVVAHEWGHAYTQFTHNLIYSYQSGALNESYSDIFGETVDLLNGVDGEGGSNNAQPLPDGQRWQVGDDVPTLNQEALGILRDMWTPTRYLNADKVSSPNYHCSSSDGGGVHSNSGVPNHAFAMLVDGKTFNGQTVVGIGLTKALHIYYRAMSFYQTSTTNFANHEQSLLAACNDLMTWGTNLNALSTSSPASTPSGQVITAFDCQQVAKAMLAVEMSATVPCNFVPLLDPDAPPACDGASNIFTEDWETGTDGWTMTSTGLFPEWPNTNWTLDSSLPQERAGTAAVAPNFPLGDPRSGTCQPGGDFSGQFTLDSPTISIPAGAGDLRLSFDQYVATEATFDGGNLKISKNGGAFTLVPQGNYIFNAPNSQLDAAPPVGQNTNPKAGEFAWHGTNTGSQAGSWGTTIVNLSSLAAPGDNIKLRFDFGQDGCNGVDGWYVDNIRLYDCPTLQAPVLSIGADYENPETNGSYTLSWTRPSGATGPDVLQESSTSCAPLLSDNAEGGLGQWTIASSGGPAPLQPTWATANDKPGHSGTSFRARGTEESINTSTTLTFNNSIPIPSTGITTLTFSEWYFNEDDDKGLVEVSEDGGTTWVPIYTNERGMGDLPDVGVNAFANESFTQKQLDLTIYSGKSIKLRFRYALGESDFIFFVQYGWYIDDISITSNNWVDIATTDQTSFTVSRRGNGTRCYRVRTTYTLGAQLIASAYSNIIGATVIGDCGLVVLSPNSIFYPTTGGDNAINVTSPGVCNYTAVSNVPWIDLHSTGSGSGNSTIVYAVRDNLTNSGRQGTITIAGQDFTVTQDGGLGDNCQFTIAPAFASYPATGGSGNISVTGEERCAWQSSSNASWVKVTSNCCGLAAGSITYTVDPNPNTTARATTITIAGKSFAVKQKGR